MRYQKISSQKVETIRLKAEQRKTNNNLIDPSALYSDIESDDEDEDDASDTASNKKASNKKSKGNSSTTDEEDEEEEEEEEEERAEPQNKTNYNNQRSSNIYKDEIDVDDI
jgi:hypothetical protein